MIDTYSRARLTKSALITAALHMAAAAVLFSRPIHLNPRFFSQIGRAPSSFIEEENLTILKRNIALEEAFNYFEVAPHSDLIVNSDLPRWVEQKMDFETAPVLPPIALATPDFNDGQIVPFQIPAFAGEGIMLIEPSEAVPFQPILSNPNLEKLEQPLHFQVELPQLASKEMPPETFEFIPSDEKPAFLSLAAPEMPSSIAPEATLSSIHAPLLSEIPDERFLFPASDFSITPSIPRSIIGMPFDASLENYGLPFIQLREWNECFDLDVKTFAKEDGGYLFSVQIIPKVDLTDYRLKQNYLFLIDRSNTKDKSRVQSAKRATARAISSLRPGDSFNVVFIDSHITSFSQEPVPYNKTNCQLVEEFLEKHSNKTSKGSTDIYTALTKVIRPALSKDETVTAILISDGGSSAKSNVHRAKINEWLEASRGRVTLHTATCGSGINLSSLKMLSLASRGTLLYSDTHAAFPRKLAKLVMDLRYPIAKEMSVSVVPQENAQIELLPPSSRLPNLFSDHPYTLLGSCTKLIDFALVLEGKNKDEVFTIKKNISLSNAKPASRLLLKQWNAEKAHMLLDKYLQEGEKTDLEKAEKELKHVAQNTRR